MATPLREGYTACRGFLSLAQITDRIRQRGAFAEAPCDDSFYAQRR